MHGRVCSRLLAISILILAQDVLHGQSESARSDVALPPLHIFEPPISEPHSPGLRVLPPGTFGLPQLARAAGIIFSGTGDRHHAAPGKWRPDRRIRRHHIPGRKRDSRLDSRRFADLGRQATAPRTSRSTIPRIGAATSMTNALTVGARPATPSSSSAA